MVPAATAMVWVGPGRPHEATAVLDVEIGPRDVLVEVELATICGSDVHTLEGDRTSPFPSVLGHEYVGRVVTSGASAVHVDGSAVRAGDRVVWSVTVSCGTCDRCRRGITQKCRETRKYGHERLAPRWQLNGGFATHVHLLGGTAVVRVSPDVPAAAFAPVSCGVATAMAALRAAEDVLELDDASIVIFGAGLIGLAATAIATDAGARVVVVDPDPARRALAERFGAVRTVDPGDRRAMAAGFTPTGTVGTVDIAIEASGAGAAVTAALSATGAGGVVLLVGSVFPASAVPLDAEAVVRNLTTVRGVHNYTAADLVHAARFVERTWRSVPLADLVGATVGLHELENGIALARSGAHVRVGVDPTPPPRH